MAHSVITFHTIIIIVITILVVIITILINIIIIAMIMPSSSEYLKFGSCFIIILITIITIIITIIMTSSSSEYLKFGTVGNGQRPDIVLANSGATAQRPMYVFSYHHCYRHDYHDHHHRLAYSIATDNHCKSWKIQSKRICIIKTCFSATVPTPATLLDLWSGQRSNIFDYFIGSKIFLDDDDTLRPLLGDFFTIVNPLFR